MSKTSQFIILILAWVSFTFASCNTREQEKPTTLQETASDENSSSTSNNSKKVMKHQLMTLPYESNALEPVISKETVEFHHGKHHLNYVNTLNSLIEGNEFETMTLGEIVQKSEGKLFNQAGQVLNHNLYWLQFSPNGGGKPVGKLAEAINKKWGSFDKFVEEFNAASTALFGAGWAWLASDKEGNLSIESEPNAGNPYRRGLNPLVGFDVWEHAYYLTYQNRRADHVKDLWSIINWEVVNDRYENPPVY